MIATGAGILRNLDPERFDEVKEDVLSFRARLETVRADPKDLSLTFQWRSLGLFVLRNVAALVLGFPLFALGMVLFSVPFMTLRLFATVVPVSRDRRATLKFVSALVMAPSWWTLLCTAGRALWGTVGLVVVTVGALPLALFTRYFLERRRAAWRDLVAFLRLGSRPRLRRHLIAEGERLSEEIQRLADELEPKVEAQRGSS
jgi:hypothetical protein